MEAVAKINWFYLNPSLKKKCFHSNILFHMDQRRKTVVFPGTFDPFTNGHLDIVDRACVLFDRVIIAVATDSPKQPLFLPHERYEQIKKVFQNNVQVEVCVFEGLLVDFMHLKQCCYIVRGLRALGDFELEFQMAHVNRHLAKDIETVFLMTREDLFYISSSVVKQVALLGGDVSSMVPKDIVEDLSKKRHEGNLQ